MREKVNVVIIDSGIYCEHPRINKPIDGFRVNIRDEKVIIDKKCNDEFGHGTAIYGIIRKHCPNVNAIPIKIFNDSNDKADVDVLISALEFVYNNVDCDIINMSVGVSILKDTSELYDICAKFAERGTIIVAAYDNFGSISYPAEFNCVLGVSEYKQCKKDDEFVFVEGSSMINVLANGNSQRCLWRNPDYQMCGGNSFACAHITGIIAEKYDCVKNVYKGNVLEFLRRESMNQIILETLPFERKNIELKGKKAVIFPFNKENHNIIRYQNMLEFDIVSVYDSKYSGKVGTSTNNLLKINSEQNYIIKNIEAIDYDEFDLFVLGHTKELENYIGDIGLAKCIIEKCLKKNKVVYSYDEYIEFLDNKNYYHPNIKWKDEYLSPLGKLYRSSTPTIGVLGTTSKQGKFSLQLILREKFINDGYEIGQISSEPTGLLFGMDYCFPFGYSANTDVIRKKMVQYINKLLHSLDSSKDVILVGSQSSTLPYDYGNIDDFTFSQIEFLFSTKPDCVVLCVNSFDKFTDIERTIKFIESSINTRVISLVVFPMKLRNELAGIYSESIRMNEEEKDVCLKKFRNIFDIPVFILGECMDELYEELLSFF